MKRVRQETLLMIILIVHQYFFRLVNDFFFFLIPSVYSTSACYGIPFQEFQLFVTCCHGKSHIRLVLVYEA